MRLGASSVCAVVGSTDSAFCRISSLFLKHVFVLWSSLCAGTLGLERWNHADRKDTLGDSCKYQIDRVYFRPDLVVGGIADTSF